MPKMNWCALYGRKPYGHIECMTASHNYGAELELVICCLAL